MLCGCGSRVPPGAQPEQSSAVGTRVVDVVLSATLGWQAGLREKPPPPSSCPPGSPAQTLALALGRNRHLAILHSLQNPGSCKHSSTDSKSQRSGGERKRLLP